VYSEELRTHLRKMSPRLCYTPWQLTTVFLRGVQPTVWGPRFSWFIREWLWVVYHTLHTELIATKGVIWHAWEVVRYEIMVLEREG